MSKKLTFEGPLNSLSLGNVSLNFLRELSESDNLHSVFPVGDRAELEAYDKLDDEFKSKLVSLAQNRIKDYDASIPVLRCWHINGAERKVANDQYLYTFYETDSPTLEELRIVSQQKHTFFSSSMAANLFKESGLDNVSYVPLGFDPDFGKLENSRKLDDDIIHFGLAGKLELRKNTQKIIKIWLEKFGNNPKYQLTCLINNPFFKPELYNEILQKTLGGTRWSNISFLPHLKTNGEVNQFINSIDVDLSGLSSGEGDNLPARNATSIGKWSIVTNCSAHVDWATADNSILVEPNGTRPCYDNMFFNEGGPFNQGSFFNIEDDAIRDGMDRAVKKAKTENTNGLKLQERTYRKTIDSILKEIQK